MICDSAKGKASLVETSDGGGPCEAELAQGEKYMQSFGK